MDGPLPNDRARGVRRRFGQRLVRSFVEFARLEASGGLVLLGCAIAALAWANSPWSGSYFELWKTPGAIRFGSFRIEESFLHWINDGLMAIFFLVVGLEIKRELVVGELSSIRLATLPIAGALGGMIAPALIFVALNAGTPGVHGWGVPMATDIAFSLGILALLGTRVPLGLKVFLAALAIVDDLGAVLVIALFYTEHVDAASLGYAGLIFGMLLLLNRGGVRTILPYALLGVPFWVFFHESGVHATVAGVLLAMTIPARVRINADEFVEYGRQALVAVEQGGEPGEGVLLSEARQEAVRTLEQSCSDVQMPLERLKHDLHPWVTFAIVPLFGLANAGVALGPEAAGLVGNPITLGVVLGLVIGKPLGIGLFAWIAVSLNLASLPEGVNWKKIWGAGSLAGIGFTMSLFIADLAFRDGLDLEAAKVGILAGSLVSGVLGFWLVKLGIREEREQILARRRAKA